jgi:hypothetical protein
MTQRKFFSNQFNRSRLYAPALFGGQRGDHLVEHASHAIQCPSLAPIDLRNGPEMLSLVS